MKAHLLADADVKVGIVRGLRRRVPGIDFVRAQRVIPEATKDPDVLAMAANMGRVLVSHDYETMPGHFYRFLQMRESPGLILIPQPWPIGLAIEELYLVWECYEASEFSSRSVYLS